MIEKAYSLWCVMQYIGPDWELSQEALDCTGLWMRTGGLVHGAGTGGTGLMTRTSGRVRGGGTRHTGLGRRTGETVRMAGAYVLCGPEAHWRSGA